MTEIERLLPQRYPFLFVTEILSTDHNETVGVQIYDQSFPFYQRHFPKGERVPSVILIESMVQCGGAGVTQAGIFLKASWGLASLEKVQFWGSVESGAVVNMIVKNLKVSTKILKQRGTAFCGGQKILEATWLCLRLT